jgi:hypothetical protein
MKKKKEEGCTGTMGNICDPGVRVETRKQKMARLIDEANNLANEIEYAEYKMPFVLKEIKELNPTKKELEIDGVQYLLDTYDL